MPEATQDVGQQMSFAMLLAEFQQVQIPIIQRDYAQGRPGHEELREDFLSALKSALDRDDADELLPLDLDFVYGSGFSNNSDEAENVFAPLDGQQRLTTLFLLHWYLAWKDGEADDCQSRFLDGQRSRFCYEVRPSSHDFFNRLLVNFPDENPNEVVSLRTLVEDKAWFFRSWCDDPTIASALTMLEEIHDCFRDCDGYYGRLTNNEHPRITFQLLELKDFGLSDDLYIKMNARGKALTPFETFKARLEQHLDEILPGVTRSINGASVSISEYFSRRMDTTWTDLFWSRRKPNTHLFDDEIMRLIKGVALISLDVESDAIVETVSRLKAFEPGFSYSKLAELGCVNERMMTTLITVLDYWGERFKDEGAESRLSRAAFDQATSREMSYPELTEFAAFCAFVLLHHEDYDIESEKRWMRVIKNLVENSDIERPSDFVDVLKSLRQLEAHTETILEYLSEDSQVVAFNRQQVREERIKAALLLRDEGWADRIAAAERHGYYKGQIEFLLKFAGILDHWLEHKEVTWDDDENKVHQERLAEYFEKSKAVFGSNGLRDIPDNKWERALLSIGDYTMEYGKNNSFLQNRAKSGERRPTWKLLLRGHMTEIAAEDRRKIVMTVLDELDLDIGVEPSLDRVIAENVPKEPWRRMLVQRAEHIAYCGQRMFRKMDGGAVYLISKLRTSSEHVELWTYHLFEELLSSRRRDGGLKPFTAAYISANTDDYIPSIRFTWKDSRIEIDFVDGEYRFALKENDGEASLCLKKHLGELFEVNSDEQWTFWTSSVDDVEAAIGQVIQVARDFDVSSESGGS